MATGYTWSRVSPRALRTGGTILSSPPCRIESWDFGFLGIPEGVSDVDFLRRILGFLSVHLLGR